VALTPAQEAALATHLGNEEGLATAIFGICWPNESKLAGTVEFDVDAGETLEEAAERLAVRWSPQWLLDAGIQLSDAAGTVVATANEPVAVGGPVQWAELRLCRVDDQTKDTAAHAALQRRIAGEVALGALWSAAARAHGVDPGLRPVDMDGNTRGAVFKHALVWFLRNSLPAGWTVEPEVSLTEIRGLHMRKNVSARKSDIVIVDPDRRLVAVLSSKWTWRSDRGTEAAQMVPLMRYRPDVPYALMTAEFPRSTRISRESVEDRAYHLCPEWLGAWAAIYAPRNESPRTLFPALADLRAEGAAVAKTTGLPGLSELVDDILASGTIL
jgi:hypothetical protein